MTRFSARNGLHRPTPPRVTLEQDSPGLRTVLLSILNNGKDNWLNTYSVLCDFMDEFPHEEIWSDAFAKSDALRLFKELEWFEVFDLLEEHGCDHVSEINQAFARGGLAYEAEEVGTGRRRTVKISVYDPEGALFEVVDIEDEPTGLLKGKFEPVHVQYQRALDALRSRPAKYETAISEAAGALEAVARVLKGKKDFSDNVKSLVDGSLPWEKSLGSTLMNFYGYASQTPGARHGRYTDPELSKADAALAVRIAGSAIAYLVEGDRTGRW